MAAPKTWMPTTTVRVRVIRNPGTASARVVLAAEVVILPLNRTTLNDVKAAACDQVRMLPQVHEGDGLVVVDYFVKGAAR